MPTSNNTVRPGVCQTSLFQAKDSPVSYDVTIANLIGRVSKQMIIYPRSTFTHDFPYLRWKARVMTIICFVFGCNGCRSMVLTARVDFTIIIIYLMIIVYYLFIIYLFIIYLLFI